MKKSHWLFINILLLLLLVSCGTENKDLADISEGQYLNNSAEVRTITPEIEVMETAASPTSEPQKCHKIAFVLYSETNEDIFTACPDGSGLTNLTNGIGTNYFPAWSADGSQIAFVSDRDGSHQIYLMDENGLNAQKLTEDYENEHPIWLPDHQKIAFLTTDGAGLWWWRILDLEDQSITQFTEPSFDFFFPTPAWSPDGMYIAYMSLEEQAERNDGSSQIHMRSIDGSTDIALTNDIWANISPIWSPDGTRIAFLSERDGTYNMYALYTIVIDGINPWKLTEPIFPGNTTFSWSPDGKFIAIANEIEGGYITIISVETGELRNLLTLANGEFASMPSWQP